jgi:UDP-N-acetylmuramoylalanine--D-glutamate ligase
MIRVTTFAGQTVAVFGLGASGLAAAQSLMAGDARVAAWDDGAPAREAAAKQGIPLADLGAADWRRFAALVLAPGVPLTHPEPHWTVRKAGAAGIPVIGDIELFMRERAASCPDAPVIAITGTNGKSTTTALVAHLLAQLGCDVEMGGNIGRAILTLEPPAADRFHVIEMSSYQIDLTPTLAPTVGVLLNITPDHLDRHGTLEHYAAVKERLVTSAEAACVGLDDFWTRDIAERLADPMRLYAFTAGKGAAIVPRLHAIGTTLFAHEREGSYAASHEIASLANVRSLRGQHNVQNALAALAALRALQDRLDARPGRERLVVWKQGQLAAALASFPGLAHRLEEIGRRGRVTFVNDSKATNADSAEKALSSFDGDIYWILGGKPKEGGIDALTGYFPRIAKAYLIGQASNEFAATLSGKVGFERCGTMETAVAAAARDAAASGAPEPVVLLSPACASFDQYRNFEVRGDDFRRLVAALPGIEMRGAQP